MSSKFKNGICLRCKVCTDCIENVCYDCKTFSEMESEPEEVLQPSECFAFEHKKECANEQ